MLLQAQQSDPQSCGATALMVALAEVLEQPASVNQQEEMALWARIKAKGGFPASLPGKMALAATARHTIATVFHDPQRLEQVAFGLGKRAAFNVEGLIVQHEASLAEARCSGIPVLEVAASQLPDKLIEGCQYLGALALTAIDERITLHWELYRRHNHTIYEMDPSVGSNVPVEQDDFSALFLRTGQVPMSLGIAVLIKSTSNLA